jgi:plastocyanin
MVLTAVGMVILGAMEVYLPSAAETSDTTKVIVKDFMFNPTPLTVRAGSTVTWTNMDDEPHTVVSDSRASPTSSTSRARITSPVRSIRAWSERSSFSRSHGWQS